MRAMILMCLVKLNQFSYSCMINDLQGTAWLSWGFTDQYYSGHVELGKQMCMKSESKQVIWASTLRKYMRFWYV